MDCMWPIYANEPLYHVPKCMHAQRWLHLLILLNWLRCFSAFEACMVVWHLFLEGVPIGQPCGNVPRMPLGHSNSRHIPSAPVTYIVLFAKHVHVLWSLFPPPPRLNENKQLHQWGSLLCSIFNILHVCVFFFFVSFFQFSNISSLTIILHCILEW